MTIKTKRCKKRGRVSISIYPRMACPKMDKERRMWRVIDDVTEFKLPMREGTRRAYAKVQVWVPITREDMDYDIAALSQKEMAKFGPFII